MAVQIISERFPVRGVAASVSGSGNPDNWGYMDTPLGFLVVVCDGVGEGPEGNTVSCIVKQELMRVLGSCDGQMSRREAFQKAVAVANDTLYEKREKDSRLKGAGSTLVAVLISEKSAMIAHLGDCRCYRIRHGRRVVFRTSDHLLVNEMVADKVMTEEEARTSPELDVVTRVLGRPGNHLPEIGEQPFRKGDRFILCTGGIWRIMPERELEKHFTGRPDMESLVAGLDPAAVGAGEYPGSRTIAVVETMTNSILKEKMSRLGRIMVAVLAVLLLASIALNINLYIRTEEQDKELQNGMKSLMSEVERLKPYELRYNRLMEGKTDSLHNGPDSLEAGLKGAVQPGTKTGESGKEKVPGKDKTVPAPSEKFVLPDVPDSPGLSDTPEAILDEVDGYLNRMKDVSGSVLGEVLDMKSQYRSRILKRLGHFDRLTGQNYSAQTEEIREKLGDGKLSMLIDKPGQDGMYRNTQMSRKALDNIRAIVEKIRKGLASN